ncbi:MAG: hypothetical protein ACYTFZ_03265 [Planctomycetota bacterium]
MASGERADGALRILEELSARIRHRREQAERSGDEGGVIRLRAMEAVVETRLIPLACPDAVVIAGEAARAAYDGQGEPEWYAQESARRSRSAEQQAQLNTAVRLLRSADIWPWPGKTATA